MLRKLLNRLLKSLGYCLVKVTEGSGFTSDRIKKLGNPEVVIDIGVAGGTTPLYEAFPEAHIVLVEPIVGSHQAKIDRIRKSYKEVTLLETAVGESDYIAEINVETSGSSRSSFLKRTALTESDTPKEVREIPVQRLDTLLEEKGIRGSIGLKIDTEGFELKVIKGCERLLPSIEFFIVEVSMAKRFEGSYTFEEFIGYMDSIGFRATDMLDFARPDAVGTRYLDLVFMPKK